MPRETFAQTMEQLRLLILAGYPVIYLLSYEEARALDCIARLVRVIMKDRPTKRLFRWCAGEGLSELTGLAPPQGVSVEPDWLGIAGLPKAIERVRARNPHLRDALKAIEVADIVRDHELSDVVAVFFDMHPYLGTVQPADQTGSMVRPLRNAADALRRYYEEQRIAGKTYGKTIIIVAPTDLGLSPELERDLIRVSFPLPERAELQKALEHKIGKGQLKYPDPIPESELEQLGQQGQPIEPQDYQTRLVELIAGAGCGLTLEDYKLGLNKIDARGQALCLRHVEDMLDLKAKAISNPALTYTPHVQIELGGLDKIKEWVRIRRGAAVSPDVRHRYQLPPPRGVMLCGASGGGKSQLAKLIAKEFNLALLRLDIGSLFGSYIGESEQRVREALYLAEVLAPVVLWLDEIDKAFQGVGGGGDNGVSARVFGYFLTWLSEKQDSVFVVTTANNFKVLLDHFPEFGRKGRFDQVFWVPLPSPDARAEIFRVHLKQALQERLLTIVPEQLDALEQQHGLTPVEQDDPLTRLSAVLGLTALSQDLTGAEIEYATFEAKYQVYTESVCKRRGAPVPLTPNLLAAVVQDARRTAMYQVDAPDRVAFDQLQRDAQSKGWPFAD